MQEEDQLLDLQLVAPLKSVSFPIRPPRVEDLGFFPFFSDADPGLSLVF